MPRRPKTTLDLTTDALERARRVRASLQAIDLRAGNASPELRAVVKDARAKADRLIQELRAAVGLQVG